MVYEMDKIETQVAQFDKEIEQLKIPQKKTLLEKLIRSAFGNNFEKIYKVYPDLDSLTQPNYPVISPRGQEIIKRQLFKESLSLLDQVIEPQKKQAKEEQQRQ